MVSQAAALLPLLAALGAAATPVLSKRDNFRRVIDRDFADPGIMLDTDGKYYAYASTDLNGHEVQVATSDDGFDWTFQEDVNALANPAPWTNEGSPLTWAPDVWPAEGGAYWMYYSALHKDTGKHCLGFAYSSDDPMSFTPLVALGDEPWACHEYGLIDPAMFQDQDGERFVVYKIDGNGESPMQPTLIMLQRVEQDGWTKVGDPIELIRNDENDGPIVEAPALMLVDRIYYLTFSSNWYNSDKYDVSYATATGVLGPYSKALDPDAPLLITGTGGDLIGPGGADLVMSKDGNGAVMLYHGWDHPWVEGDNTNYRQMYAARVGFNNGAMSLI